MNGFTWLDVDQCSRLCQTLGHSLWQAPLTACAAWLACLALGSKRLGAQYVVYVAALLLTLTAAPVTYLSLQPASSPKTALAPATVTTTPVQPSLQRAPQGAAPAPPIAVAPRFLPDPLQPAPGVSAATEQTRAGWPALTPWLTSLYVAGVVLMGLKLAVSTVRAERLAQRAQPIEAGPIRERLRSLGQQMAMRALPRLREAERIATPKVVGLLRPTILLPTSALTGLPPDEIAMLLAHELAHVRRHDLWVNLVQRVAEALLFFNPAAWWLSRRISVLREYCCDEAACAAVGQSAASLRLRYAAALLHAVELNTGRAPGERLAALAASGRSPSELRRRVARLVGEPLREPLRLSRGALLLIAFSVGATTLLATAVRPSKSDQGEGDDDASISELRGSGSEATGTVTLRGRVVLDEEGGEAPAGWFYYGSKSDRRSFYGTGGRFDESFECEAPAGIINLRFFPEGYAPQVVGPFELQGGQTKSDIEVVLTRGLSRMVEVVDEQGVPIPEATVLAHPLLNGSTNGPNFPQTTDADGMVRYKHLRPDTKYRFNAESPGYQALRVEPRSLPDSVDEPVRLTMLRARPATGLITNADGSPAPIAKVLIKATVEPGGHTNSYPLPQNLTTADQQGRYRLDSLRDDVRYLMVVEATNDARIWVTDIEAGQNEKRLQLPKRCDLLVRVHGAMDALPARKGGPYVAVGQPVLVQWNDRGVGETYAHEAIIEPTGTGGQAIVRGLVIDTRDNAEPQRVDVMLGQDQSTKQTVEIKQDGDRTTVVDFAIDETGRIVGGEDALRVIRQNAEAERNSNRITATIVGPDGQPVPNADMEIRGMSGFDPAQLAAGRFVKKGNYGVFVEADEQGRLAIDFGESKPTRLSLTVREPGFGPYWAGWNSSDQPQPIPETITLRLDNAWSVGGIVTDEEGRPIAGAKIRPSISFKMRPGDPSALGIGTRITTAEDGSWRYDLVPDSTASLSAEITHPEYAGAIVSLARDEYGVRPDAAPSRPIVLSAGLVIAGRVTDEGGNPIENATVRSQFHNDVRSATTDADGAYRLIGARPGMTRVVASAPGRAIDFQEVRVDPDMRATDFQLQAGRTIRVRVVDEAGAGIPGARIFFQQWRGRQINYFEFDHVHEYTDDQGVWEWREAPVDGVAADICRPNGQQLLEQQLLPREEEYVFTPPRKLEISGRVFDAENGEPIKNFRVTRGLRNGDERIGGINWIERESYEATDGAYRVAFNSVPVAALVRIEAPGYRVTTTRDILAAEGPTTLDLRLDPAEPIAATVLTPNGEPAGGARVAVGVPGSYISLQNGRLTEGGTYAQLVETDEQGRLNLPRRDSLIHLVITHDAGFAHVISADGSFANEITLTAWARVEGVFRVGTVPTADVIIEDFSTGLHSWGPDVPNIYTHNKTTTGPEGRYVFDRLIPGNGRIGRNILLMVDDGATEVTSSSRVPVNLVAGQTTRLDLGGVGRPVVGQMKPPTGTEEPVLWNFALMTLSADLKQPPFPTPPAEVADDPAKRSKWYQEWRETEAGKAYAQAMAAHRAAEEASPYLTASIDRDGSFRFDDVPAGRYVLRFDPMRAFAGEFTKQLEIKLPGGATQSAEAVDLGELQLVTPPAAE